VLHDSLRSASGRDSRVARNGPSLGGQAGAVGGCVRFGRIDTANNPQALKSVSVTVAYFEMASGLIRPVPEDRVLAPFPFDLKVNGPF